MKPVTAQDLKRIDPHRFAKEYEAWLMYCMDYEWWDCTEQCFTDEMASMGVRVDKIAFSLSCSQGDYASFEGRVDIPKWMAIEKCNNEQTFAEAYPALYLAVAQDGGYMRISEGYRRHPDTEYSFWADHTEPDGVFKHLDEEGWVELVEEQEQDADLESNIREWVYARCKDLQSDLQKEYDYLSSEQSFIESCECNDVTFELETEDEANC